jgi:hypothetical protein
VTSCASTVQCSALYASAAYCVQVVPTSIVNEHYCRHFAVYNVSYTNHALAHLFILQHRRQPCDCSDSDSALQRCQCCYKLPSSLDSSGRPLDTIDARKTVLWLQQHAPKLEECKQCPLCCVTPAKRQLQKVVNHPAQLNVSVVDVTRFTTYLMHDLSVICCGYNLFLCLDTTLLL